MNCVQHYYLLKQNEHGWKKTTLAIYAENKKKKKVCFHWLGCLLKLETLFFFTMLQKVIACCLWQNWAIN